MPEKNIALVLKTLNECCICCIFGHEDPDADCLASQSVMASWMERHGKTVHKCSIGPWDRTEIAHWQALFESKIPQFDPEEQVLKIFVDCSSPERTGFPSKDFPAGTSLIIDHHAVGSEFGEVRYIDPQSPSTTLLILELMNAMDELPVKEEAELLFLGFCTDTGFFRFLKTDDGKYLNAAAQLVDLGASPKETHRLLTGGRSLGSRQLLGRVLQRTELQFNGRLAISWETYKDWQELGTERDKDMCYQLLTGISGVEVVALIKEQQDSICSVGLRSNGNLDVGSIAGFFNGGGHRNAAGCKINGDRNDARELLMEIIAVRLSDSGNQPSQ